jgi:hypothetical protein
MGKFRARLVSLLLSATFTSLEKYTSFRTLYYKSIMFYSTYPSYDCYKTIFLLIEATET